MKTETLERTRWFRSLVKHFGIYRGDPTPQQLEMLGEIQGRVRLVVKARWIILLLLSLYGLWATLFLLPEGENPYYRSLSLLVILILLGVAAYNLLLQQYHRELSHLNFISYLQVLLDLAFVTLFIHLSGGAVSWLWTLYLLVTLEASFLIDRSLNVWGIGAIGSMMYGMLLAAEYHGLLRNLTMPFIDSSLHRSLTYVTLIWLWVTVMNAAIAVIGAFFMKVIRAREHELKLMVIRDQMTGLYNRGYFFKMLNSEIQRSLRYGRVFSVLILDIDDFKKFNDSYGHLEGDELLKRTAQVFRKNVRRNETPHPYDIDIPCRYGGEEFAILLPETPALPEESENETGMNAVAFAERIRREVEAIDFRGHRITVSIGLASFPQHGKTPDSLVKAADEALYRAKREGKNQVVLAEACWTETDPTGDGAPEA